MGCHSCVNTRTFGLGSWHSNLCPHQITLQYRLPRKDQAKVARKVARGFNAEFQGETWLFNSGLQ